ncbi:ferritin-like domain-containing protein [Frateuria aurantia]
MSSDRLQACALQCLQATDPDEKVRLTHAVRRAWAAGELQLEDAADASATARVVEPGRPQRPQLVSPRALAQRGLGTLQGRQALVHAVAHIEFNAINLAWDAVYRFRGLPRSFYQDWIDCADDEARHFVMVRARLRAMGSDYGDFDAHDGLWEMARRTADSLLARMALVPRVLEARGLDVTPGMIARLQAVGDEATVQVLEVILREEVAHVAAGTRWYRHACDQENREPIETFLGLVRSHMGAQLRGPFNRPARLEAGFLDEELDRLARLAVERPAAAV